MIRQLFTKYRQILLYLFFGVTTTAVNWCIYGLLHGLLQLDMTLSNAFAWLGAVLYAFVTNKLFVFESKSMAGKVLLVEGVKFFASRALSGAFEILLPTALFAIGLNQPLFGLEGGIAKALVSVLVIVTNYVLSKFLVFQNK
jgi:putative flippase GtrA